ncbi:MAG: FAD-dependent oxidoreductase [Nanoarchaeota archaeon]|nr:FAD-dependent oxidoreductase [Nanoarchaeota archaeon]MBU1004844.1 FAD-dependent oxidoreductase [Nanoarchaeota archaeon]MBU1946782.1 FAD-dependent oxidoreductase [Nanoarchaeota archaeon]
MKIVILGLGAAGFGAALAAKKQDRNAEITIIDEKDFDLMHQCGLPWVIDGELNGDGLKHSLSLDKMGIKLVSNTKIDSIDLDKKLINGSIGYDKLIIATGAKPFVPHIKTENKIFTIHNIKDTEEIKKNVKKGEKAIVIGAGAIGLEAAVALKKKGMDVTVIDMLPCCFPKAIDKDISEILEEKLKQKGIKLELGKKIEEIKEKSLVVMATGVKPNVELFKDSGLKIGKGGIEVNEKVETSVKDVYAVGDCCAVSSLINKEKWNSILANNAYREGMVAGINAAGGDKEFKGILGTFVSVIDDVEIAATGFNSFFAEHYGIKTVIGKAKGKNRPEWFGPANELTVKIIADEKGKVIGGQAIGAGAKERINIISTAIKAGMTLKDISELELAYCPAVSDYYDVLVIAAEIGIRKIK